MEYAQWANVMSHEHAVQITTAYNDIYDYAIWGDDIAVQKVIRQPAIAAVDYCKSPSFGGAA